MADNKQANFEKVRRAFGDEVADKLGNFQEAPGGGKPLGKGEKAPSKDWVRKNRKMQPRDDEGKFTYNAVNLKPLKYGPSRGTTVPPIVKADIFEKIFNKKETTVVNENNRQKIVTRMGVEDFVDAFRQYNEKYGFGFDSKTKTGRWSKEEKTGQELSKKLGKPVTVNKEKKEKRLKKKETISKESPKVEDGNPKPTQENPENLKNPVSLKQTAEQNKELIGQMVELGVSPADAAKIVATGKVQNIEQFKQMMGI